MKNTFLKFAILTFALPLVGCSAYQSDGRKFLEKQAYEFAGVKAQANLTGCGYSGVDSSWSFTERTEQTASYVSETEDYRLKVMVLDSPSYGCEFQFESAQELYEKSTPAAQLTLLNHTTLPKPR